MPSLQEPCRGKGPRSGKGYQSPAFSLLRNQLQLSRNLCSIRRGFFTVGDKGSQKPAEKRKSSQVLQAPSVPVGLGVFKVITNECVHFTSTLVSQREESILRMCSKLRVNFKEKHSPSSFPHPLSSFFP